MGFGFIIGGFCPGTSLVAAATAKIDGIFFVLGVFFGIFLFGETVGLYESFWYSSYLGRFTLPELFNVNTGWVVLGVVFMALFMFWGGEKLEIAFGGDEYKNAPVWRTYAAGGLVALALAVLLIGQPTRADRWNRIAAESEAAIASREVQAHPGEVLEMMHDDRLNAIVLDVRNEADYNAFHLVDAVHAPPETIDSMIPSLIAEPANTVIFVMSNDETEALEIWKALKAEAVPNVYVVAGGVNEWITTFADDEFKTANVAGRKGEDVLSYAFPVALGSRYGFADPNPDVFDLEYEPIVKLEQKRAAASGGCG
jgi:rhodanese-related sulfurtransferase